MVTVRIDDDLLEKLKIWLNQNGNKYKYPSVTSFINNAIYEKLKLLEGQKK
jgi:hypothetical protein